jgi:hypothetical protein
MLSDRRFPTDRMSAGVASRGTVTVVMVLAMVLTPGEAQGVAEGWQEGGEPTNVTFEEQIKQVIHQRFSNMRGMSDLHFSHVFKKFDYDVIKFYSNEKKISPHYDVFTTAIFGTSFRGRK